LVEAAHAAARTKASYLAAQYARLRGRRGPKKAALAVAHSILVIAWHLLSRGEPYTDLGADYFWCGAKQVAIPSPLAALVWAHHNPLGAPPGC
jgi:hypothetical protein